MKLLCAIAFSCGAAVAAGSVLPGLGMLPNKIRAEKPASYKVPLLVESGNNPFRGVTAEDVVCNATLEVAFSIDLTESFSDDVPKLQTQIPLLYDLLKEHFPGSKVAVTSFRDKPIVPLGYNTPSWSDDCLEFLSGFDDDEATLVQHLGRLYTAGGYDYREAQLEAIMRVAVSERIGWTPPSVSVDPNTGNPIGRFLVVVTDCTWHEAGDAAEAAALSNETVEGHSLHKDPSVLTQDHNHHCKTHEYPSYEDLSKALASRKIYPIFLTQPCGYVNDEGNVAVFPDFHETADKTGNEDYRDPSKGMVLMYRDLLHRLNLHGAIASLEADASNLVSVIKTILQRVPEIVCSGEDEKETTAKPTTEKPTTKKHSSQKATTEQASSNDECECHCEKDPCACPCKQDVEINVVLDINV